MTPPAPTPEEQAAAAVLLGMLDQDTLNWAAVRDAIARALATTRARGRAEGLEEAAKVADEHWSRERTLAAHTFGELGERLAMRSALTAEDISAAIRALKDKP